MSGLTRPRMRALIGAAGLAGMLVLSGCSTADPADPASTLGGANQAIDNVSVVGETWTEPRVTIGDVSSLGSEIQRTVVNGGTGPEVTSASTVFVKASVFDVATKQEQAQYGVLSSAPIDLSASNIPQYIKDAFIGVKSNSRIAVLLPSELMLESTTGAENVGDGLLIADVDVLDQSIAWGTPQAPVQDIVTISKNEAKAKPEGITVAKPATEQPELIIDPVLKGDGDLVLEGQTVVVQYQGMLLQDGKVFDSSWQRGEPAQFQTDQVVPGFGKALVGQTVGSRVIAIIPADLAYGAQPPQGGSIPANAPLVFVIDILKAH